MNQRLIPILILSALSTFACGGGDGEDTYTTAAPDGCTPGSTQVCSGPGACSGAQVCSEDGTYWGECVCGTNPGTGGAPGTGGTDPGTGGVINPPTGGTGGTPSGGGTGGDVCVPKTCDQIALDLTGWSQEALSYAPASCYDTASCGSLTSAPVACGWASDGCGNLIDCSTCPEDGTASIGCGDAATLQDQTLAPSTANICGSRCALVNTSDACSQWGHGNKWAWHCPSSIPPVGLQGCTHVDNHPWSTTTWCCNPS